MPKPKTEEKSEEKEIDVPDYPIQHPPWASEEAAGSTKPVSELNPQDFEDQKKEPEEEPEEA